MTWYRSNIRRDPSEDTHHYERISWIYSYCNIGKFCNDSGIGKFCHSLQKFFARNNEETYEDVLGSDGLSEEGEDEEFYESIDRLDDNVNISGILPLSDSSQMRNRRQGVPARYPAEEDNLIHDESNDDTPELGRVDITTYADASHATANNEDDINDADLWNEERGDGKVKQKNYGSAKAANTPRNDTGIEDDNEIHASQTSANGEVDTKDVDSWNEEKGDGKAEQTIYDSATAGNTPKDKTGIQDGSKSPTRETNEDDTYVGRVKRKYYADPSSILEEDENTREEENKYEPLKQECSTSNQDTRYAELMPPNMADILEENEDLPLVDVNLNNNQPDGDSQTSSEDFYSDQLRMFDA